MGDPVAPLAYQTAIQASLQEPQGLHISVQQALFNAHSPLFNAHGQV
jgi:hypothetical protein